MKTRTSSPVRLVTSRWVPRPPFYLHFIFGCSVPIPWSGFNYCCLADPWPPLHQNEPHLLTLTVVALLTFPTYRSSALSLLSCLKNETLFLYPEYKSPHNRCSVNSLDTRLYILFNLKSFLKTVWLQKQWNCSWDYFSIIWNIYFSSPLLEFIFFCIYRSIFQPCSELQSMVVKPSPSLNHNTDTC